MRPKAPKPLNMGAFQKGRRNRRRTCLTIDFRSSNLSISNCWAPPLQFAYLNGICSLTKNSLMLRAEAIMQQLLTLPLPDRNRSNSMQYENIKVTQNEIKCAFRNSSINNNSNNNYHPINTLENTTINGMWTSKRDDIYINILILNMILGRGHRHVIHARDVTHAEKVIAKML